MTPRLPAFRPQFIQRIHDERHIASAMARMNRLHAELEALFVPMPPCPVFVPVERIEIGSASEAIARERAALVREPDFADDVRRCQLAGMIDARVPAYRAMWNEGASVSASRSDASRSPRTMLPHHPTPPKQYEPPSRFLLRWAKPLRHALAFLVAWLRAAR